MGFWKDHRRKIYLGLIAYLVSFTIGIINAQIMGVDLATASEVPTPVWIVGVLAQLVIMALFSLWYFASRKVVSSVAEGVRFGLTCVILGFVVEILLIIPSIFFSHAPADPFKYYTNPFFWLSVVVTLLIPALVGAIKRSTGVAR